MGEIVNRPDIGPNLLFYKIGVLGGTPLDFPRLLADEIDADFLSSDHIRKELADRRAGTSRTRTQSKQVQQTFARQAREALGVGDVVGDIFFNSPRSRLIPHEVAHAAGDLVVALNVHTPLRLAKQRVEQWAEEDAFELPVDQWEVHPAVAARRMMGDLVRPTDEESIDYLLRVDGSTDDNDEIIDQVCDQLMEYGWLEEE